MFKKKLRWGILWWLFIIVLISYFDRVNFSIAAPLFMKELGFDPAQLGLVLSGFTIGYTILNFPGGFLAERFSSRRLLTVIVVLWSIMTIFTGIAWSFVSLMLIRICFGLCEGPMPPANTKVVNSWMMPGEKATASGLWLSAVPVGVILGNLASSYIVTNFGWRSVFYIFGVMGLIVALITWKILRDTPEEHPTITPEEIKLIKSSASNPTSSTLPSTGSTLRQLLANPMVWMLSIIYFSLALIVWANLNWLPTYFVQARGTTLLKSGFFSSIPWMAGLIGSIGIGWLADNVGERRRVPWLALSLFGIVPFTAFAVTTPSLTLCLASFSISLLFGLGSLTIIYAVAMDMFERADVAKVTGIMLAWGSFAGIIAPSLIGYLLKATNSFNIAYYTFATIAFIGGCCALTLIKSEKEIRRKMVEVT